MKLNFLKFIVLLCILSQNFLFFSCGEEDGQFGKLMLSLTFPSEVASPLSLPNVSGFKVKIYNSTPLSLDAKPFFGSPCDTYRGNEMGISNIPVGKGKVVVFEGYLHPECKELIYLGVRGGIEVKKEKEEGKYYFIPVYKIDGFTSYPLPNKEFVDKAKKTICDDNDDCKKIHPAATCNTKDRICTFLETLFPLNSKIKRSFHTANALKNGEVFIVGGYNEKKGTSMTGINFQTENPVIESFNPSASLFSTVDIKGFTIQHSFHSSLKWDESLVFIVGGAQRLIFKDLKSSELFTIPSSYCLEVEKCESNLLMLSTVIDFNKRQTLKSSLPIPLAGASLEKIETNEGQKKLLIAGGWTLENENEVATNKYFLCDLQEELKLTCDEKQNLFLNTPRSFHSQTCVKYGKNGCIEFLIFGGNSEKDPKNLAELYKSSTRKFETLTPLKNVKYNKISLNEIVNVQGRIFSFGGTSDLKNLPDIPPLELIVDSEKNTIEIKEISFDKIDINSPVFYRVYHRLTLLSDGKILVTGGINNKGKIEKKAIVFAYDKDQGFKLEKFVDMTQPRILHSATLLEDGLLKGGVLIVGGFTLQGGELHFVEGAEMFYPRPLQK